MSTYVEYQIDEKINILGEVGKHDVGDVVRASHRPWTIAEISSVGFKLAISTVDELG